MERAAIIASGEPVELAAGGGAGTAGVGAETASNEAPDELVWDACGVSFFFPQPSKKAAVETIKRSMNHFL